jgi:DNA polymerase I-like protein with 3'-5' exonuclease and polymerase domains
MRKPKIPKPVTVDFETFGIEGRPKYPPIPVGVSIKYKGMKAKYYAWGHATNNNSSYAEAREALEKAWAHPDGVLFHNHKFDVDVAATHMDLPELPWDKYHDTMFLVFLDDPNQIELGLKPSATRLLNMPPDEQDAVADWLVEHQPLSHVGVKIGHGKSSKEHYGKYIAFAPGDIVGKYADGDVIRTERIFEKLWPSIVERGMLKAYDRERELAMILLDMERQGVRLDLKRLRSDVAMYSETMVELETYIRKSLKAPDLNIDAGAQLIDALIAAGKSNPDELELTPTGKYKSDKTAIGHGCHDKTLAAVLKYRSQLKTCLNTFMKSWLATAEASGGFIFTSWNQTKSAEGSGAIGTRTGRLSSTPNFQNIPKEFAAIFAHDEKDLKKAKLLPKCPFKGGLPPLPLVRSYIIPYADGDVLIDRDYSQQEPRILAHFEDGALKQAYIDNPWIDYHDNAKEHLERVLHRPFERKPVKNINLGIIYGQGVGSLAIKNGSSVEETKELKDQIFGLYPGLRDMYKDMRLRAKTNTPIHTWGGREYYCEPPKLIDGRLKTFDYKMVNTLIQGSAGDCTKEAIIRYYRVKPKHHRLLLNVHDQLTASVPKAERFKAMEIMRHEMEGVEFDVLILSEGSMSETNWAELIDTDKKGKPVNASHH